MFKWKRGKLQDLTLNQQYQWAVLCAHDVSSLVCRREYSPHVRSPGWHHNTLLDGELVVDVDDEVGNIPVQDSKMPSSGLSGQYQPALPCLRCHVHLR